ncbi:BgTH12-06953 [Blumeria graminis f. sp. triticale]|uniref:Bgt-2861 n=3 Tax=Blumeria graminis TaxID=34373 RepID=A0A381L2K2_BLUGR|nr:transporter of the ATP-binding cassette family [Blumeria graminis f. sp. tritici 96224]CAD6506021.1 BgTH12-06953 [Blumeria graminis f. sp. triticale]VDB94661.1 Bgt-2861 [Blumeria graminis f. sp. tritici]
MDSLNTTCISGAEPVRLNTDGTCNLGFLCLNSTIENPPTFCAPTPECLVHRLQSVDNVCYEPQGDHEPIICAPGYYCSPGGKTVEKCPKGHFCSLGAVEPTPCGPASICPSGAWKELVMDGFIAVIVIDFVLLVLMIKPVMALAATLFRVLMGGSPASRASSTLTVSDIEEDAGRPASTINDDEYISEKDRFSRFAASVKRCVGSADVGMSFSFKNVSRTLESGKEIVAPQTGHIEKGTLWGVMGASGAGKTSFVNLIMGKTEQTDGEIFVNRVPCRISKFKRLIGYVPQDDVLMAELTVRENIMHSARIRLPSTWTDTECTVHVDTLISCLGLSHVQNNVVGDAVESYISGGQRKRVSIGMELAAAPLALFLDEPTSGLDSTSALSIVRLLKTLSQLGVTIICIIHQPRLEILEILDGIHLLGRGRQLYHGKISDVASHFESMGFDISGRSNIADAIMDIISDNSTILDRAGRHVDLKDMAETWCSKNPLPIEVPSEKNTPDSQAELEALTQSAASRGALWHKQASLCFTRSIKQQWQQKKSFALEIGVGATAGLLIGLSLYPTNGIHFQGIYKAPFELLSSAVTYSLVPQIGLFCCLSISLAAAAPGVKIFGEEKQIYWREASAGHSRSAYYVGKVISTLPRISISAIHYTAFFYILATPLMNFWRAYVVNLMYFYCIYGLASITSMLVRREDGPLMAMIVSLIISVFSGYGPPLSSVEMWHMSWFWRSCPGVWYTEALYDQNLRPLEYLYDIRAAELSTRFVRGRFGVDVILLAIIGSIYRVFAYFGLTLLDRHKQR